MTKKSKHVSRKRAAEAIEELPGGLQKTAFSWLDKKMRQRRGSESYGEGHPQIAVDAKQLNLMQRLNDNGLSHRVIERVMHLQPQSGMDSHRCVKRARSEARSKAAKKRARAAAKA